MESVTIGFTPDEENQVRRFEERQACRRTLGVTLTRHPAANQLATFCDQFTVLAPGVTINRVRSDEDDMPGIFLGPNLRFYGIPLGSELPPFLTALETPAGESEEGTPEKMPPAIRLYVSNHCPYCPVTFGNLAPLALSGKVNLTVIDGTLFAEAAEEDRILSLPTVIAGDGNRWTGVVTATEIMAVLSREAGEEIGAIPMERMLTEGGAGRLAGMMISENRIFGAFTDLLVHEKMPVRLGAMVTMETLIEADDALAARAVRLLWERFSALDDPVKGDLLYIFGEAAPPSMRSKLGTLASSESSEEIREMATEAIERINERFGQASG